MFKGQGTHGANSKPWSGYRPVMGCLQTVGQCPALQTALELYTETKDMQARTGSPRAGSQAGCCPVKPPQNLWPNGLLVPTGNSDSFTSTIEKCLSLNAITIFTKTNVLVPFILSRVPMWSSGAPVSTAVLLMVCGLAFDWALKILQF